MGQTTTNGESLKYERPGPKGGKVPRPETMSPLSPDTPPEYDRKNSHGSTGMFNRSSNLKENRKKDRDRLMSQLSDNSKRGNDIVNPADELQWLNFETRIRGVIKGLLQPVVEIS